MVDSFFTKVLADGELKHNFKHGPMDKLLRMLREFFSAATGGPITHRSRPLSEAHRYMAISKREFQRFTQHLLEPLLDVAFAEAEAEAEAEACEIISHVNLYADEITNDIGDPE